MVSSIESTFSRILKSHFCGGLGAVGAAYTYHGLKYFGKRFWEALQRHRVFVIFDEIHHCAGDSPDNANVWGAEILTQVQRCASYTLALTGTPWRTDNIPIVLADYTDPEGRICCDYVYGLHDAIVDKVCRKPKVVLINSNNVVFSADQTQKRFDSISAFLSETLMPYQSIVCHPVAMRYVIQTGCEKLREIRNVNACAGGLVVASSVEHAYQLLDILINEFAQSATIVTHQDKEALSKIAQYRQGTTEWIVSVGMISEGTDIPRLQVCCHLSAVQTELYFRQVLGRILRVNQGDNQEAWLFTLATEELTLFSERLAEDLPQDYNVLQAQPGALPFVVQGASSLPPVLIKKQNPVTSLDIDTESDAGGNQFSTCSVSKKSAELAIVSLYEQVIDAFLFSPA